jgi:hypothetical protein
MRNREVRLTVILTVLAVVFTIGCQKKVTPHPNQLNAFDGQAYDSLVSAQAALDEAKGQYASGKLPPASKAVINDAGAAYESARTGWVYWRDVSMGIKSGDVNEAQAKLQDDLAQLSAAIAKIAAMKGAKQ